jgi:RNA polymerase sigma-70 factor, ECF subfamily
MDKRGIGAMTMFMQPLAQKLFTAFKLSAVLEH